MTAPTADLALSALDLSGRRVVVTGGGSGIGAACAARLAAAGAEVVVLDLSPEAAGRVAEQVGGGDGQDARAPEAALGGHGQGQEAAGRGPRDILP